MSLRLSVAADGQTLVEGRFSQLFSLGMEFGGFAIDGIGMLQSVEVLLTGHRLHVSVANFRIEDSIELETRRGPRVSIQPARLPVVAVGKRGFRRIKRG